MDLETVQRQSSSKPQVRKNDQNFQVQAGCSCCHSRSEGIDKAGMSHHLRTLPEHKACSQFGLGAGSAGIQHRDTFQRALILLLKKIWDPQVFPSKHLRK